MTQMLQMFDRLRPAVPVVLRLVLGGLFVYHGYDKFDGGIDMVEQIYDMWGVPAASMAAPATAVVEIAAGLALIVGLGTRVAVVLLGVVMLGALYYVKRGLGIISTEPMPGAELDLALLAGVFIVVEPGSPSVDSMIGIDSTTATTAGRRSSLASA